MDVEEEFVKDVEIQLRTEDVKRRYYENNTTAIVPIADRTIAVYDTIMRD
jgi:hypothetical protein